VRSLLRGVVVAVAVVTASASVGCAETDGLRLPPREDDPGLTSLIARRIAIDPKLCRYDVTVVVYNRTARLEGKVSSDAERGRAEHLAREAGALRVDDQLAVDPATGDGARC
jgi:osmotically-inducible protein OsmY